jgi:hypothetical protein
VEVIAKIHPSHSFSQTARRRKVVNTKYFAFGEMTLEKLMFFVSKTGHGDAQKT